LLCIALAPLQNASGFRQHDEVETAHANRLRSASFSLKISCPHISFAVARVCVSQSAQTKVVGTLRSFVDNNPLFQSGASMKLGISKIAIGVAIAIASTSAMAADGQFFINGEGAGQDTSFNNLRDRDPTSWAGAVRLGYLWNAQSFTWGVETGYVDLGQIAGTNYGLISSLGGPYDPLRINVRTDGEILGGVFKAHFGDNGWFFSSRAGWIHTQTYATEHDALGFGSAKANASDNGFYVGAGIGYDFSRHFGVSLNYDLYHSQAPGIWQGHFGTSMYGGTAEFRF
jgi:OmpA-OmpF porin, OOP family